MRTRAGWPARLAMLAMVALGVWVGVEIWTWPAVGRLATARPRPSVPQAPQIDTVLQNDLTPAFTGTESVQAALDKAAADIDPLLTATH